MNLMMLKIQKRNNIEKSVMKCADANKYLAEDRIMCLEIIAKKGENFILNYIPGAK
jgi:cellulose synthase/poly-beta-1,6-N-acetylglucosamine synthase-like glycosyltransferase